MTVRGDFSLLRGFGHSASRVRGGAVSIGNFDGVHLGHQHLLRSMRQRAPGLPITVVLFEPQPVEFFRPHDAPGRIMNLREKLIVLRQHDVDAAMVLRFNRHLAQLEAPRFVEALYASLAPRHLWVGHDFRFGAGRRGDYALLEQEGDRHGFTAHQAGAYLVEGVRVSSTTIRSFLGQGEIAQARRLSGRDYFLFGRVVQGKKNGRALGFPTANIALHRASALHGAYAVQVEHAGARYYGMANIGYRPTLGGVQQSLEVHLFDFSRDIYGHRLTVTFLHHLRGEVPFTSLRALQSQLHRDEAVARSLLATPL